MSEAQILNIGTLVEKYLTEDGTASGTPLVSKKTGEPIVDSDGNAVRVLELKMRQNVDVMVNGSLVDFKSYTIKGRDGSPVELRNKILSLTSVESELYGLNKRVEEGKVNEETANSIKESYERDNVLYTVKITSANQA